MTNENPDTFLQACPITEEGIELLGLKDKSLVVVINLEDEGSGAGLAGSQDNGDNDKRTSRGGTRQHDSSRFRRKNMR